MNRNLNKARRNKNDEFYTQLADIERELKHYKKHFKDKIVFCNCDDPRISNFFRYFSYSFEHLKLRQLIITCYKNQQIDLFTEQENEGAVSLIYNGDKNGNKIPDVEEIGLRELKGDGDFRSDECIEILRHPDVIPVTNPPFSLFGAYMSIIMKYGKKFLIIGNLNAIGYKEIFPLVKENRIWLGVSPTGMTFLTPEGSLRQMGFAVWFTNLPHKKRNEPYIFTKKYAGHEKEYPKYDGYNIINVSQSNSVPEDYEGVMGLPLSFLSKYNPNQFEILGVANSARWIDYKCFTIINGRKIYDRLLIKRI